jgi:hypothetical protein
MLSKYRVLLIGMAVGAVAGWLYWKYEGCVTGSCPITSQPVNSSVYGAVMGALVGDMFRKKENKS